VASAGGRCLSPIVWERHQRARAVVHNPARLPADVAALLDRRPGRLGQRLEGGPPWDCEASGSSSISTHGCRLFFELIATGEDLLGQAGPASVASTARRVGCAGAKNLRGRGQGVISRAQSPHLGGPRANIACQNEGVGRPFGGPCVRRRPGIAHGGSRKGARSFKPQVRRPSTSTPCRPATARRSRSGPGAHTPGVDHPGRADGPTRRPVDGLAKRKPHVRDARLDSGAWRLGICSLGTAWSTWPKTKCCTWSGARSAFSRGGP